MKNPILLKFVKCSFPLWLWAFSTNAYAAISNKGILDDVLSRYSTAASTWGTVITAYASWLFWTLTLISMVWTFGMMILRKADIGEFFAEFIRFTVFTGFFFWLLTNRMTPPAVFLLPFFQLYSTFGLMDTHIAVALAHLLFNVPLAVWILEGFMSGKQLISMAIASRNFLSKFFSRLLNPASA